MQAQTVNLAVKSDEAQLIRLAENAGELSLFLRKDGDKTTDNRDNKVTTLADLLRSGRQVNLTATTPTPPPAPEPAKLPFGLNLDEIEKAKKPVEKEPEPKPIEPIWKVTIERVALLRPWSCPSTRRRKAPSLVKTTPPSPGYARPRRRRRTRSIDRVK